MIIIRVFMMVILSMIISLACSPSNLAHSTLPISRLADLQVQFENMPSAIPAAQAAVPRPTGQPVALTFDDGPDNYYTLRVLDILGEHGIKATFFVVGSRVAVYPEVLTAIAEQGHAFGNHSYWHRDSTRLSQETLRQEIMRTEEIITATTGGSGANIFRPPYGASNKWVEQYVSSMGFETVKWTVDPRDWAGTPVPKMMENVIQNLTPNGIILLHSSGGKPALDNMLTVLPQIIAYAEEQGYYFVTIPELLEISSTNQINR